MYIVAISAAGKCVLPMKSGLLVLWDIVMLFVMENIFENGWLSSISSFHFFVLKTDSRSSNCTVSCILTLNKVIPSGLLSFRFLHLLFPKTFVFWLPALIGPDAGDFRSFASAFCEL